MESVASKIQETGQHAAKRTDAIFNRTREAGESLIDEVRGVGGEVAAFVRAETKGWKRYFTQRATHLQSEAKSLFTVPAIERRVLSQIDSALRSIDSKVRARLAELEKPAPVKKKTTTSNGAAKPKATPKRAASSKSTARTASTLAGTAPSIRH